MKRRLTIGWSVMLVGTMLAAAQSLPPPGTAVQVDEVSGRVSVRLYRETDTLTLLRIRWTSDGNGAARGDFSGWGSARAFPPGTIRLFRTKPDTGATSPTANYSVSLLDDNDVDLFGGAGAYRSASQTQWAAPFLTMTADTVETVSLTTADGVTTGTNRTAIQPPPKGVVIAGPLSVRVVGAGANRSGQIDVWIVHRVD